MKENKERGITLVALVVTVIIMLILAAIGIGMSLGDNGLITKSKQSREMQRGTEVKEYIRLQLNDNKVSKYLKEDQKSKMTIIQELYNQGKITEEEAKRLNKEGSITIGGVEIDFSQQSINENIIGTKVAYSANGQNNWIVFGEEENGDILITTEAPIETDVSIPETAGGWLDYEDTLNEACSVYGTTINGKEVKARSITLEDINKFLGIDKIINDEEDDIYTFGTENDYENKKVDYLYPRKGATAMITYGHIDSQTYEYVVDGTKEVENWMKATNDTEEGKFKNEYYRLYNSYDNWYLSTTYYNNENISSLINSNRLKYIFGNGEYDIATKMARIYDEGVNFNTLYVWNDGLSTHNIASSDSNSCEEEEEEYYSYIRPIVQLPLSVYLGLSN